MKREMVFCRNCSYLGSINVGDRVPACPECGKPLFQPGVLKEKWSSLDVSVKNATKAHWVDGDRGVFDYVTEQQEMKHAMYEAESEKKKACSNMLITSGFNFDGYRVVKYSGYISGDDVVEVDRGMSVLGFGATHTGSALTESLVKIRRRALQELKEAAYDLGCNAVIGVDFDYITLEPETANLGGGTTYLPYVFCVTANGNAVVIEKDEPKQSAASILKEYKELLDCGAITWEEFEMKKRELL